MHLADLKNIIKKGESERLEFKSSTGNLSSAMQTICAFLNSTEGGVVVFGVTDQGKIIGQAISDKTRKEIATELNRIEPFAKIDTKYVEVANDKFAIVITVEPGLKAPYTYDGRSFIRNQSTTGRMTKEEYIYLHNQNNQTLWKSLTNNSCKVSDLDRNRIKEIIRMAVFEKRLPEAALSASIPDTLKKLNLITDDELTNASVILFCKNEDKQFIQSHIKLARFKGIDKSEFLDTKSFKGNAFDLYDKAMDFLSQWLPVSAKIESGKSTRIESPAIPHKVLREAMTNALVHRDYSNAGGSIDVAVYDDRVNITNIGALPKGVALNQLAKEHPSIQRNPIIAHVFYLCGKIEKWGRGTQDMILDCKKSGNPLPIYEEIGGSFSVTFPLKEPISTVSNKQIKKPDLSQLTDRQKEILKILRNKRLKASEILEYLSIPISIRTAQVELSKLKEIGLVKSEGKAKASLWSLV